MTIRMWIAPVRRARRRPRGLQKRRKLRGTLASSSRKHLERLCGSGLEQASFAARMTTAAMLFSYEIFMSTKLYLLLVRVMQIRCSMEDSLTSILAIASNAVSIGVPLVTPWVAGLT
jgi:hypothetical protein